MNRDKIETNIPPAARPRRIRRTAGLRRLVREKSFSVGQLVHPIFVAAGRGVTQPIASMPGHSRRSADLLDSEIDELVNLGIPAVLLFGIPENKDASGSEAWSENGPVPQAIRRIRARAPEMVVIADVCLCEYTDHGHCGVLDHDTRDVRNDDTLLLRRH